MKSEVHVSQVKPHPECLQIFSCPWPTTVVPVSICCGLDSSETLQELSQGALIPPEATALTASGTLLIQSHTDCELSPPSKTKIVCFGSSLFSREHMGCIMWRWRWNFCCHCLGRDLWGEEPCWIWQPTYKPWKSEAISESCLCSAVLMSISNNGGTWCFTKDEDSEVEVERQELIRAQGLFPSCLDSGMCVSM